MISAETALNLHSDKPQCGSTANNIKNDDKCENAYISALQRFSVGDGPGIRTTVFFQGCNLSCKWCHNPETISLGGAMLFYENLCQNCGLCELACANSLPRGYISYENCNLCGNCAEVCAHGARILSGKKMHLDTIMDIIFEDLPFYENSGGGVTLSGGEPLLQADFAACLAKRCKGHGISVIVDTAGCVQYRVFEQLNPFVDTYYYDLKGPDALFYKNHVGGDFGLICANLGKLVSCGADVVVRFPLIPSLNDDLESLGTLNSLLLSLGVKKLHLLPYHRLGLTKYKALGIHYTLEHLRPPSAEQLASALSVFSASLNPEISG